MNRLTGFANSLASIIISTALAVISLLFTILGITFLPVVGIAIAIPVMGLSFRFLNLKPRVRVAGKSAEAAYERGTLTSGSTENVPWFEQTLKAFG